jgi:hypothetical protein
MDKHQLGFKESDNEVILITCMFFGFMIGIPVVVQLIWG